MTIVPAVVSMTACCWLALSERRLRRQCRQRHERIRSHHYIPRLFDRSSKRSVQSIARIILSRDSPHANAGAPRTDSRDRPVYLREFDCNTSSTMLQSRWRLTARTVTGRRTLCVYFLALVLCVVVLDLVAGLAAAPECEARLRPQDDRADQPAARTAPHARRRSSRWSIASKPATSSSTSRSIR